LANTTGLVNVNFPSFKATAAPVIEGLEKAKLIRSIAETMFAMNSEVFMVYSLT